VAGHSGAGRRVAFLLLCTLAGSCEAVIYADDLVSDESRTGFVTTPAAVASMVGFVIGIPVDLVASPITYPFYLARKARYPDTADPVSILLFPSFVLSRAGAIVVGAPLDVLEFTFYRVWRGPPPAESRDSASSGDGVPAGATSSPESGR
jgi:hypothetical protein